MNAAIPEPSPVGDGAIVLEQVIIDLNARANMGKIKYGTMLKTNNGRDALMDAYQESLDQTMYLCQTIMERNQKELKEKEKKLEEKRNNTFGDDQFCYVHGFSYSSGDYCWKCAAEDVRGD